MGGVGPFSGKLIFFGYRGISEIVTTKLLAMEILLLDGIIEGGKAIRPTIGPYLKPEEALIYCNLKWSKFTKKCEEFGIYMNPSGFFKREDLDRMLAG